MKSVEIKGNVRTDVGSKYAKAERKAGIMRLLVIELSARLPVDASIVVFAISCTRYKV